MGDEGSGERAGETVTVWVPIWQRVWLPVLIGVSLLTVAGVQTAQGDAPVALFGAGAMALAFWNWRVPILFADSAGVSAAPPA